MPKKLAEAGVRLCNTANKRATARELFESIAAELGGVFESPSEVRFIVNDRAGHGGAGTVPMACTWVKTIWESQRRARSMGGGKWVGVSTHNVEQV